MEANESAEQVQGEGVPPVTNEKSEVEEMEMTPATEESTQNTEEEKAKKIQEMEEKIKQRRKEIAKEEEERKIESEKKRREMGKSMSEIKHDIEWKQMQKIAEERKREKREARLSKQRVKEQIAQDRAAMKKQQEEEKRLRNKAAEEATPQTSTTSNVVRKDYTDAKLQLRLPDGSKLVHTFSANESLGAVRLYIELNGKVTLPFTLSTTYPHKEFNEDDLDKPLNSLGLVPTAVLQAKIKKQDPV